MIEGNYFKDESLNQSIISFIQFIDFKINEAKLRFDEEKSQLIHVPFLEKLYFKFKIYSYYDFPRILSFSKKELVVELQLPVIPIKINKYREKSSIHFLYYVIV